MGRSAQAGSGKQAGNDRIACLWLSLQYDWCSWIPNAPPTMRAPPPTAKGVVTIEQIVDTLPDRGRSCWHLGAVWALSQFQENEVRPFCLFWQAGCPGLTHFSISGFCDSGLRLDTCSPGILSSEAEVATRSSGLKLERVQDGWGRRAKGILLHW